MLASQTPTLVPLPFAANGAKNVIPEASQISVDPGAASLNDGFPPVTFIPIAAGGIAPDGSDVNGIFNLISSSTRWSHAGGAYTYNAAFATDPNVGGYPQGAQLTRADYTGFWINTTDNNQTNPDAVDGSAAGWVPGYNYGVTPIAGLTNANVALTPAQAAKNKITLAGALTGNVQIIFPAWIKEWEVVNNATGALTITAKTAAGTGVVLAAGQQKITGDGTNITQPAESIAPGTLPGHAVQLGQVESTTSPLQLATAPSTLAAHAVQQAQVVGVGQTLTNMTASRSVATTYTNSTGKPIIVYVLGITNAANGYIVGWINGIQMGGVSPNATNSSGVSVSFLVPAGATYQVTNNLSTMNTWYELR